MIDVLTAMPKYEAYKYSGYEWIGDIPENWELTKLGRSLKPVSIKKAMQQSLRRVVG